MDDIARYNLKRWNALVEAGALWTRPWLKLDADSARKRLDAAGLLGDVHNQSVLCLASSGGQQAPAFALLGAQVTSFDLSDMQLRRDREAAAYYHVQIETIQGDMRDLSRFADDTFDIVWQPHSINFVPDAQAVFREVARVLRCAGLYYFGCANPFFIGLEEKDWNGEGYVLKHHYVDEAEFMSEDAQWVFHPNSMPQQAIHGVRQYRYTLSTIVNGLVEQGFVIQHVEDCASVRPDANAAPGTWDHFVSVAPPWMSFWTFYNPELFLRSQQTHDA